MSQNKLQKVAILLSALSVVLVLLVAKFITMKMDRIAAAQFGGEENYAIAQKLFASDAFKAQQKTQLENALATMGSGTAANTNTQGATTNPQDPTASFPSGKLTTEQLAALKKDAYVQGDANAKITIVEYSDPECPYCIRQAADKTIENTIAAFPGSVNNIMKVVQGVNHPGTEYKSLAILCAGKLGWLAGYAGMYQNIFTASTPDTVVPTAKIPDFAKTLGIDAAQLEACIKNGDTKSVYAANWAEFQTFTSSPGTPGNIVINNETGEWKLIAGAYPVDTFKQVISTWVK